MGYRQHAPGGGYVNQDDNPRAKLAALLGVTDEAEAERLWAGLMAAPLNAADVLRPPSRGLNPADYMLKPPEPLKS